MADIVGAFGVPHTPFFPFLVQQDGPQSETAQFFASMRAELEALQPDLIVMASTDHLNTFFFDNYPIFGVGVDASFKGPNDQPRAVPDYGIPSRADFAAHLRQHGVAAGFDLALVQEFSVDHSFVVPLHFMTPTMNVPVVPIFVSGHLPPLPSARRCYALGRLIRTAVESWPEALRVVVMGSGSFSLDVSGPTHRARQVRRGAGPGLGHERLRLSRARRDRTAVERGDRGEAARRRQCRRRIAELDRDVGRLWRRQADFCQTTNGEWPRLCRVAEKLTMSVYAVNHLLRQLLRDPEFRAAMKADPAAALSKLNLTDDERKALLAGDVAALYRMGVNAFLMGYLVRFEVLGLDVATYGARIRSAAPAPGAH